MRIHYNVTGRERKALVNVISEVTGAQPVYKGMPTAAYEVDYYTITKDGTLQFSDRSDSEEVEAVLAALAEAGFEGIGETSDNAHDDDAHRIAGDADGLTITLHLEDFDSACLERLKKLVASKATLIRKAMDADRLEIQADGSDVSFPWWDALPDMTKVSIYTAFITALCRMAKTATRVTATERDVTSEKYAFRGFLLRLGFIGPDSALLRKTLLKPLSGSCAFRTEADQARWLQKQIEKRNARKAEQASENEASECEDW